MAYQSLYRRYRSQRFGEIIGQPHVVTALRNAVRDGRVGHAYLFSGPRGTGKTSMARILAKALNCTNLADGEPCGACEACKAVETGTSYDLFELDAASNNKVEDVRELISRVAIGSPGRTKVYILDEVHMLSAAASNALLKTLEEPPDHVTFVLATTDPQKVLPTIRSRSQHFEFGLIPAAELERHVRWVISDAGLSVDDEAIAWVVRKGAGSARDTLSALDQVAAAGGIGSLAAPVDELLEALCERDSNRALVGVAAALTTGREPRLVAEELLGRLREAFLAAVAPGLSQLPDADAAAVRDVAKRLGAAGITRSLEAIGAAIVEMRQAPDARALLEVALVRLTRPELDPSGAALLQRIAELEERVERLAAGLPLLPGTSAGAAPGSQAAGAVGERNGGARPSTDQPDGRGTTDIPDAIAGYGGPRVDVTEGAPRADVGEGLPGGGEHARGPGEGTPGAQPSGPGPGPGAPAAPAAGRGGAGPARPARPARTVSAAAGVGGQGPSPSGPAAGREGAAAAARRRLAESRGANPAAPTSPAPAASPTVSPAGRRGAGGPDQRGQAVGAGAERGRGAVPNGDGGPGDGGPGDGGSAAQGVGAGEAVGAGKRAAGVAERGRGAVPSGDVVSGEGGSRDGGSAGQGAAVEAVVAGTGEVAPAGGSERERERAGGSGAAEDGQGGGALSVELLSTAWTEWVLDHLPPPARALYKAGRFVAVEGDRVSFALPNEVHRDRCEARRPDVEARLGERLGRAISVRLVVDGSGDRYGPSDAEAPILPEPLGGHDDEDIGDDVHALADATDVASTALERLIDTFPGAEVVE